MTNAYDSCGILTAVTDKAGRTIWKVLDENARGQQTLINRGGKTTAFGYDGRGLPTSIQSSNIVDLSYSFNSQGNLQYRLDGLMNQKEQFTYDSHNRLTKWDVYQNNILAKMDSITYEPILGNIIQKSDLENLTMNYGENGRPHALTSISGKPTAMSIDSLNVTYTDFKKISTLKEGSKLYTLSYGVDDERRCSFNYINGSLKQTRYYLGDYEEEVNSAGNIRKIHYLSGGAVYIQNYGKDTLLYGYSDYQGSLIALADEGGNVVERYAYDSWGQRRNPNNWTQKDTRTGWRLNRGYTGHEHLDAFSIINMNGRVYDPLTSMFFSPDPYVQAPDSWLNYNRYGYCINNPLKYTDPSGEIFGFDDAIVIAAMMYMGGMQANFMHCADNGSNFFNPGNWDWSSSGTYIGMANGAVSGAGMVGIPILPQAQGLLLNGITQASINVAINGVGNVFDGDPFFQGWAMPAAMGFASGAYSGYNSAKVAGLNPWTGSEITSTSIKYTPTSQQNGNASNEEISPDGLEDYVHTRFGKRLPKNAKITWSVWDKDFGLTTSPDYTNNNAPLNVDIPRSYLKDPNGLLYDCVGHEIKHINDYASGNVGRWMKQYKYVWKRVEAIMDYRAYNYNQWYSNTYRNGTYDYSINIGKARRNLPPGWKL